MDKRLKKVEEKVDSLCAASAMVLIDGIALTAIIYFFCLGLGAQTHTSFFEVYDILLEHGFHGRVHW